MESPTEKGAPVVRPLPITDAAGIWLLLPGLGRPKETKTRRDGTRARRRQKVTEPERERGRRLEGGRQNKLAAGSGGFLNQAKALVNPQSTCLTQPQHHPTFKGVKMTSAAVGRASRSGLPLHQAQSVQTCLLCMACRRSAKRHRPLTVGMGGGDILTTLRKVAECP